MLIRSYTDPRTSQQNEKGKMRKSPSWKTAKERVLLVCAAAVDGHKVQEIGHQTVILRSTLYRTSLCTET